MNPRMTDVSNNNKPIVGVLDAAQVNNAVHLNEGEFIAPKRNVIGMILTAIVVGIIIWAFYEALFQVCFSEAPVKNILVGNVNTMNSDMLSFELQSKDYYLSNDYSIAYVSAETVNYKQLYTVYITVKKPIVSFARFSKSKENDTFKNIYEVNISDVSAVYYGNKDNENKLLIWKMKMD